MLIEPPSTSAAGAAVRGWRMGAAVVDIGLPVRGGTTSTVGPRRPPAHPRRLGIAGRPTRGHHRRMEHAAATDPLALLELVASRLAAQLDASGACWHVTD